MTAVTDSDIKELKDLINSRFDKIEQDLNEIDKRVAVIETRLDEWKPSIQKISDLTEILQ